MFRQTKERRCCTCTKLLRIVERRDKTQLRDKLASLGIHFRYRELKQFIGVNSTYMPIELRLKAEELSPTINFQTDASSRSR